MLKAIVFDFDGVVVDSEPVHYQAFLQALKPHGLVLSYADYLRHYVGYDDRDCIREVLADRCGRPDLARDAKAVADLCAGKNRAFHAIASQGVAMIPGSRQFIDAVTGRWPLAIASGAVRSEIELILAGLGMGDRFELIVAADDVERSKPDPATYRLAHQRLAGEHAELALEPAACLAIEDTAAGIISARGAGLRTLGLATSGPAAELAMADRVVDSLGGITVSQLEKWFGSPAVG